MLLVRHAAVAVKGVCYGQSDVPTVKGAEEAAHEILAQLAPHAVDAVWTSPFVRTEPVARCVAAALGVALRVDARVSEISMGEWEGRLFSALEQEDRERFSAWMADWQRLAPPGGESLPAFLARIGQWLPEVAAQRCLVVTHAGVIRAVRALRKGVPYAAVAGDAVPHLVVEAAPDAS